MATISDPSIVSGLAAYDEPKASARLNVEIFKAQPITNLLSKYGVINRENKLESDSGSTVNIFDRKRVDSKGTTGDHDRYTNADDLESGSRQLSINLLSHTLKYSKKGSFQQQITPFELGGDVVQLLSQWNREFYLQMLINQLGGNTGTTLTHPKLSSTAFTSTADRLKATGFNTAIAPSTLYHSWGNQADGSISADESVDSSNPLRLIDFMNARETITSTSLGVPLWQTLDGSAEGSTVEAIALVSVTGMNQLKFDATTSGQGYNFAQMQYAMVAGGNKSGIMKGPNLYYMENMLFVEVPDNYMPRGVNSSSAAAVANTRRAIICGMNAVDVAVGKGYGGKDGIPGTEIIVDEEYKKNNKKGYATSNFIIGCKKVQVSGQGSNASTNYDRACYVITHYSRT